MAGAAVAVCPGGDGALQVIPHKSVGAGAALMSRGITSNIYITNVADWDSHTIKMCHCSSGRPHQFRFCLSA